MILPGRPCLNFFKADVFFQISAQENGYCYSQRDSIKVQTVETKKYKCHSLAGNICLYPIRKVIKWSMKVEGTLLDGLDGDLLRKCHITLDFFTTADSVNVIVCFCLFVVFLSKEDQSSVEVLPTNIFTIVRLVFLYL